MTSSSTVLIVEDDTETSALLETYFRSQGYQTACARRGDDAEPMAVAEQADIILLDVRLPGCDGYEVVRRLRANRRTSSVPILMISDQQDRVDRLKGLESGVEDYIAKPFDLQELGLRVRNSLERAKRRRTTNPITGLPEGKPVEEALLRLLVQPEWSVLTLRISDLDTFRAARGFPVADSLLQALTQVLKNLSAEKLKVGVLIGHLSTDEFLMLSDLPSLLEFAKSLAQRLSETAKTFYPVLGKMDGHPAPDQVGFQFRFLSSSDGFFDSLESLQSALDHTPLRTL